MYKVLIADDEDIICRGLAGMVSKHPRLQVVATAEDGEIAFKKAQEEKPDLMFVDINMPFLNGLDFIRQIKEVLPEVVIIIVSGYDDFEYVQKALHLGVTDYLLKPIMEEDFFDVLNKIVKKLDSMDNSKRYMDWVEEQVEQNRLQIVNDFFDSWIKKELKAEQLENEMEYLKIHIPQPYQLTIIHIYKDYEKENNNEEWNTELVLSESCGIVLKCFEPYSEITYFQVDEGALAIISKAFSEKQWEQLSQKLSMAFEERLNAKIESAYQAEEKIYDFPDAYNHLIEIYKERIHYSDAVRQSINIINSQYSDNELSLQSVADSLFVSSSYLSRIFLRETGENFSTYLTRKRINEAKSMLENSNMKMYMIAQKVGYTSQHYFSNIFKKTMGISPADYRKNFFK